MDAENLRHLIKHQGHIIAKEVYMSLYTFVQRDIPREFAACVEHSDTKFGIADMLKLAEKALTANLPWSNAEEQRAAQEKLLKPITDRINKYIYEQLEVWQGRVLIEIERELRDLEAELGEEVRRFDVKLQQAVDVFSSGNADGTVSNTANPLQTVIALTHGDISLAVEGAAIGGMSWSKYFERTFIQAVLNWMIGALFGSAILVPAMIVELGGILFSSRRLPRQLLNQIGPVAFKSLKEKIEAEEMNLISDIQNQFFEQSDDLFEKATALIEDEEKRQNDIVEERNKADCASHTEHERQLAILDAMKGILSTLYFELYNIEPNKEDIELLSKNMRM